MKYGKKDMLFYDILPASLEGICELDQESIMSSNSDFQIQEPIQRSKEINLSKSLYSELTFAYGRGDQNDMCDNDEFEMYWL